MPRGSHMKPITFAIAGCGNFTRSALPGMMGAAGWELTAAVDPDEASRTAFHAASGLPADQIFADELAMYERYRPDVVFVHTPVGTHVENCLHALEAGCNVCCQKPFVHDLSSGVELVERASKAGRWISVAQTSRLTDTSRVIAEAIRDGSIGTPGFGHHTVYRDRTRLAHSYSAMETWPVIHATGIHTVDLFRFWFGGRIRAVSFRGIDCAWNPYRDPGAVAGWMEMDSGVVMTCLTSFVSAVALDPTRHPYEDNMIQGSEGALHWNGPWDRGPVELIRRDAESPMEVLPNVDNWPRAMTLLMDSLADTLRSNEPLYCPAADNLWSIAALAAAQQSAEHGGRIEDVPAFAARSGLRWPG